MTFLKPIICLCLELFHGILHSLYWIFLSRGLSGSTVYCSHLPFHLFSLTHMFVNLAVIFSWNRISRFLTKLSIIAIFILRWWICFNSCRQVYSLKLLTLQGGIKIPRKLKPSERTLIFFFLLKYTCMRICLFYLLYC